ncbi:PREDICTED: zinc finger protein Rlf-like, partial [Galeopterus variegatus]|uniref:Zinc finger protein Rlf-like n=1 Tax=Galeopterus variegatus TaxID=482537 RepID=A0ABM0SE58_GALVR
MTLEGLEKQVSKSLWTVVTRLLLGRLLLGRPLRRPSRGVALGVLMMKSGGRRRRQKVRHHARAPGGGAKAQSRGLVAYALLGRGKMADGKGDAAAAAGAGAEAPAVAGAGDRAETDSMARGHRPASPVPGALGLRPCLWQLETELREQEVSEVSSLNYCRSFCQTLLQYASNKNASEHIVYLLEVYRLAIQSFASARPYLTTECEDVLLVLGRLVLSCFELLLSVSESELPSEVWVPFLQSLQESHDALLEFGNNNLQILVHVTKEGVWKNPVLLKILSQQPVETEEVNKLIAQEGPSFLQMRIKHLLKSNCIPQATALSKLCAESKEITNVSSFQQAYITCLCSMLPSEDAIKEGKQTVKLVTVTSEKMRVDFGVLRLLDGSLLDWIDWEFRKKMFFTRPLEKEESNSQN